MPYHYRRRNFGARRRFRRTGGFGRVGPSFRRPTWTRRRRVAQNLTREVRWFKGVGFLRADNAGILRFTMSQNSAQSLLSDAVQFTKYATIWEEYKILKMMVKFYPARVGSESLTHDANPGPGIDIQPLFYRGDAVTWVDPQGDSSAVNAVIEVMGKPSAKIVNARRFHKRWLDRPKSGYPTWGKLTQGGGIALPDPWDGMIRMFGDNFSPPGPAGQPYTTIHYWTNTFYKVLFRSRQDG